MTARYTLGDNAEDVRLSVDDALARLDVFTHDDGRETIHTFQQGSAPKMLLGTDWERASVEEAIREAGGALEAGAMAQGLRHGLALVGTTGGRRLFFATTAGPS